uniref:HEAT repeat domain-containing protein n=1 Tax=Legionella sp. TaxID=459 RepID=UPI00321FCA41
MANTMTDFFSPLPRELLIEIYSNLDLKALLRAWNTYNRRHQRAIEHVLFAKNDVEFYAIQMKMLTTLFNLAPILMPGNNNYLNDLVISFSTKVKNPKLSLSDRLRGLKLLGTIRKVPLDITQIISKLNAQDPKACRAGLNCLKIMAPALKKEILATLVEPVKNRLNDLNWRIRHAALNCLAAMTFALEKETLASLVEPVTNQLNDQDWDVSQAALNCLTTMVPALEEETVTTLIAPVKNILINDQDLDVCQAALNCLVSMTPVLGKDILTTLVEPIKKLSNQDWEALQTALICLAVIARSLDKEILATFVEPITTNLNSPNWYIREATLNCL